MLNVLPPDHPLQPALQAFNQQYHAEARERLAQHVAQHGDGPEADELAGLIATAGRVRAAGPPALVWQYDNARRWESEWIAFLTGGLVGEVIEDFRRYATVRPRMLVVENELNARSAAWLRSASLQGAEIVLLHLGDGGYRQDCTAYRWCRTVFRNHYSRILAGRRNVHYLPLGWKAGFWRNATPKPAAKRSLLWSFAGDIKKTTRMAMLTAMSALEPGRVHVTSGWNTPDLMPVADYRAWMDETIFAPCPSGFASVDSFRLFEALEAGCIPIVDGRDGPEYFEAAMGPHPLPVVRDWAEVPALVARLQAENRVEALRAACHDWWTGQKCQMRARLAEALA